jgi:hypothetical protein
MRAVGIDDKTVRDCVLASNATAAACAKSPPSSAPICKHAPNTNTLLQAELEAAADQGVWLLPSARVEDVLLVGGMQPRAVLGAICSAFQPVPAQGQLSAPAVCGCLLQPTDAALAACATGAGGASDTKTPGWAVALGVVGVLGAAAAVAALWWVRRTRTEMRAEMEQYIALAGGPKEEGVGRNGVVGGAGGAWSLASMLAVPGSGGGWQRVGTSAPPGISLNVAEGGALSSLPPAQTTDL